MTKNENFITITGYGDVDGEMWTMNLDLGAIANDAGRREKERWQDAFDRWHDSYFVVLPIPQARKILKLIARWGRDDDFQKCDEVFKKNDKLLKLWKSVYKEASVW